MSCNVKRRLDRLERLMKKRYHDDDEEYTMERKYLINTKPASPDSEVYLDKSARVRPTPPKPTETPAKKPHRPDPSPLKK